MAPGFNVAGWPTVLVDSASARTDISEKDTSVLRRLGLIPLQASVSLRHASDGMAIYVVATPDSLTSVSRFYSAPAATPGWTVLRHESIGGAAASRLLAYGTARLTVELRERADGGTTIFLAMWQ